MTENRTALCGEIRLQARRYGARRCGGRRYAARFAAAGAFGLAIAVLACAIPSTIKAAGVPQARSTPQAASAPKLSDHEIEALPSMSAQQQAQLLLERGINHYEGALELIDTRVSSWYGQLEVEKGPLASLLNTAINANDLRVRAASLEITLAGYNLP